MTEIQINLDLIEIIQFCLKIYDLGDTPPMSVCMVRSRQITKNQINLDLN